jgi:hypothetical protein
MKKVINLFGKSCIFADGNIVYMKKILLAIALIAFVLPVMAQDNGRTLKPNYRKIAKVVAQPSSPYFLDSLLSRFSRCDNTMTVDDLRCLYYGGDLSLHDVWQRYQLSSGRFGRQSRQASKAWTQYQMMTTAVWSTGDGSKRKPLYVRSREDAEVAIMGYDTALWFKMKGKRKFSVAPRQ